MQKATVFAAQSNWPRYDSRARDGMVLMLPPVGSMEQHARSMPLHTDVLLLTARPTCRGVIRHVGGAPLRPGLLIITVETRESSARDNERAQRNSRRCATRFLQESRPAWQAPDPRAEWRLRELRGYRSGFTQARRDSIGDIMIVVMLCGDFVGPASIDQPLPGSLHRLGTRARRRAEGPALPSFYLHLVEIDWAVGHPAVFPPGPNWMPSSVTLSSRRQASKEKGEILIEVRQTASRRRPPPSSRPLLRRRHPVCRPDMRPNPEHRAR